MIRGKLAGAVLHGRAWRRSWGDDRIEVALVGGGVLLVPAGDFTQVNDEANGLARPRDC